MFLLPVAMVMVILVAFQVPPLRNEEGEGLG